jgi:Emfourin
MRREVTIDTARLAPRAAEELERLVQKAPAPPVSAPGEARRSPDRFRYTLAVEDGEQRCAWTFDEERPPETLRPLVEAVQRAAKLTDPESDPETA